MKSKLSDHQLMVLAWFLGWVAVDPGKSKLGDPLSCEVCISSGNYRRTVVVSAGDYWTKPFVFLGSKKPVFPGKKSMIHVNSLDLIGESLGNHVMPKASWVPDVHVDQARMLVEKTRERGMALRFVSEVRKRGFVQPIDLICIDPAVVCDSVLEIIGG